MIHFHERVPDGTAGGRASQTNSAVIKPGHRLQFAQYPASVAMSSAWSRVIPLFWKCLCIMLAGGLGSLLRYGLTEVVEHFAGKAFPYGTMLVNLLGCFVFGIVWALFGKGQLSEDMRLILLVGFLGGFTTFSSFAFHNEQMLTNAQWGSLLFNVLVQNIVGIVAVWLGIKLVS